MKRLAARGGSLALHRNAGGAPVARRNDREYREYLREEQRRQRRGPQRGSRVEVERGCVARRMQPDVHRGLLASIIVGTLVICLSLAGSHASAADVVSNPTLTGPIT